MGDGEQEPLDLRQGVDAEQFSASQMLSGQVDGQPVLLARLEGGFYAIGGECSHYGAPLGEGLLAGETVRCPWHHARFCLKTGQAVGAPAFNPVARWAVEVRDGRVFVTGKLAEPPAKTADAAPRRVVIVGAGAAGFAAAQMLRQEGFAGQVTLLSADADPPYDRPSCSKEYLEGKSERNTVPLKPKDFYAQARIDLRLRTEVEQIDPQARKVSLKGGEHLDYDVLILATGAEPLRPDIPGLDGPNVHLLRSLQDADALIAACGEAKHVAMIGASFIGLEAAAALRQRGLEVHVVAPDQTPLEKIVGRDVGEWIKGVHEKEGVIFHLGRKVRAYTDGQLLLDSGDPIAADLVVVGAGVEPRLDLAKAAGLKIDDGVIVDDHLRTSADGIYAAGDIARYPDPVSGRLVRIEHWVHAARQGQYLARQILGATPPFQDPPFFWTKHYARSVSYSGHAEDFDTPVVEGDLAENDATVRYNKNGALLAVATIDRDLENLTTERAFESD